MSPTESTFYNIICNGSVTKSENEENKNIKKTMHTISGD